MNDRSLDEFLSGEGADAAGDETCDDDPEPTDGGRSTDATDTSVVGDDDGEAGGTAAERTVDPAVSTYRVPAEPTACADCGESVRAVWRDDDAFVCGDCKTW
jgi:hypothetical protein